ncbi:MAG: GNAT family N-acetyltransferase [Cytophagaceae bacterium]
MQQVKETITQIKTAEESSKEMVMATLTLAFSADPFNRWVFKDSETYLQLFPKFAYAFGGRALSHSSAFHTEGYAGVSLWLPPKVEPDMETLVGLAETHIREEIKEDAFSFFEQMDRAHPKEPCWYLPLLGVDPFRQNEGQGSKLLRHALHMIDQEGMPAYLESSNPRNIPLYERFGFQVSGELKSGNSPSMYPMFRKPQKTKH